MMAHPVVPMVVVVAVMVAATLLDMSISITSPQSQESREYKVLRTYCC